MKGNHTMLLLRRQVNTVRLPAAVIPANPGSESGAGAGIQSGSRCRIKSGMTPHGTAGPTKRSFLITALFTALLTVFGSWSCSKGNYTGKVETVIIGTTPIELNALIYVADEYRFFTNNGVQVVFKDYDTGVAAVDGLLKRKVDMALTTEFVIVGKSLQKQDVLDLATIDKSMLFYIIARHRPRDKDHCGSQREEDRSSPRNDHRVLLRKNARTQRNENTAGSHG